MFKKVLRERKSLLIKNISAVIPEIHILLQIIVRCRNWHPGSIREWFFIPFFCKARAIVQPEIPDTGQIHYTP
jgi:hypothetical protein